MVAKNGIYWSGCIYLYSERDGARDSNGASGKLDPPQETKSTFEKDYKDKGEDEKRHGEMSRGRTSHL